MRHLKHILIFIALAFSLSINSAHAILIDRGTVTYDTATNLEWLDLSLTDDLQPGEAVLRYRDQGWSIATGDQYRTMFDSFFTDYVDDIPGIGLMTVTTDSIQYAQLQEFMNLFGLTAEGQFIRGTSGLYWDEGIIKQAGVLDSFTYGTLKRNPRGNWTNASDTSFAGVFLVRASVPEATPLVLLGMGLFLFSLARRKV